MKPAMKRLLVGLGMTTGVVVIAIASRSSLAEGHAGSATHSATVHSENPAAAVARPVTPRVDVDWTQLRSAVLAAAVSPPATDPEPEPAAEEPDPRMREFQAKVAELNDACALTDACDARQLLMDQLGLALDLKLGPSHPARKRLVEVAGWSYDEREKLGKQFRDQDIDRRTLFATLTDHFRVMGQKYEDLLSDAEYEQMFATKKGQNPATFLGITPEMADTLERQEASSSSVDGQEAAPEVYTDPIRISD